MYINILPSTILTKGRFCAAIFDIEQNSYTNIPLSWYKIINDELHGDIELCNLDKKTKKVVDFLIKNNLVILSDFKLNFISIDKKWDIPFEFHTLIIDATSFQSFIRMIDVMPNRRISMFTQIRLFYITAINEIKCIIENLVRKKYYNIEIITNKHSEAHLYEYKSLLSQYPYHLSKLVIMGAYNKTINERLILNKEYMEDDKICGKMGVDLLSINIETYKKYYRGNTCLWKKISIDKNGYIKNCPSMKFTYGTIFTTDIMSVLSNQTYKNYSELSREKIEVCNNCELRIFCIDCRAFTLHNKRYGVPSKCYYFI